MREGIRQKIGKDTESEIAAWPGEDHAAEGAVSRWAARLSPAGRAGMREGSAGSWRDRRRC